MMPVSDVSFKASFAIAELSLNRLRRRRMIPCDRVASVSLLADPFLSTRF
jgi:hypothetical protein